MQSKAKTPIEYIKELPSDRRQVIKIVRETLSKFWPKGMEERMQYGMISYVVPLDKFPKGYLNNPSVPLPFAAIAAQKNHYAIYLLSIYSDPKLLKELQNAYKSKGMKLDIGKSCVRFKNLSEVDLAAIGKVIKQTPVKKFIEFYEKSRK